MTLAFFCHRAREYPFKFYRFAYNLMNTKRKDLMKTKFTEYNYSDFDLVKRIALSFPQDL